MKILFLTLRTFSATGGIEKVCRVLGQVFREMTDNGKDAFNLYSLHDGSNEKTEPYISSNVMKGFKSSVPRFIVKSFFKGITSDVVIISHSNLLLPAYLIKLCAPKTKMVLIAHGIEIWQPLSRFRKRMLKKMTTIVAVSHFTRAAIITSQQAAPGKVIVTNNCLDPYLPMPAGDTKRNEIRKKYRIEAGEVVLMTLSRLSAKEQNKHYDKVLVAIQQLSRQLPKLKYLFVGKYDEPEKERLELLQSTLGITGTLIFTGFVPDHELAAYYAASDVYIMPSEKEGFGISFIEAMYYNKPVIAGNRDGTCDALDNGNLGVLIDPHSQQEITKSLKKMINNIPAFLPDRELLLKKFSYETYKQQWTSLINLN